MPAHNTRSCSAQDEQVNASTVGVIPDLDVFGIKPKRRLTSAVLEVLNPRSGHPHSITFTHPPLSLKEVVEVSARDFRSVEGNTTRSISLKDSLFSRQNPQGPDSTRRFPTRGLGSALE